MHFEINGTRYAVAISTRPILLDGEPCKARIDHRAGRIWLSGTLEKHERRFYLLHELRHGWIGAHGRASDPEADADQAAQMMGDIMDGYLAQGGDATLESLRPAVESISNRPATATMALREAECGYCAAHIALGSIAAGKPEWSDSFASHVCDRGFLCDFCDKVTSWREICDAEGVPLGSICPYPPPRVLTGAAAAQWLAEHQATARVVMA